MCQSLLLNNVAGLIPLENIRQPEDMNKKPGTKVTPKKVQSSFCKL